jgi:hypothetical protein
MDSGYRYIKNSECMEGEEATLYLRTKFILDSEMYETLASFAGGKIRQYGVIELY